MKTNKAREDNIAHVWFIGSYSENEAKRSCKEQELDWDNVQHCYGRLYEQEKRYGDLL